MESLFNFFGERLNESMKKAGFSNKDITKELNLSKNAIGNYKNNQLPNVSILYKLSQKLGVSMEWLLTGKEGETEKLTENEKELLTLFRELSERSQIKILGIVEDRYKEELSEDVKSSTSKIG